MNRSKGMVFQVMVLLLVLLASFPAQAKTKQIKSVGVNIKGEVKAGKSVNEDILTVTPGSGLYDVDFYTISVENGHTDLEPGDVPVVKISLSAKAGYVFATKKNGLQISAYGGTLKSFERMNSGDALLVTVELPAVSGSAASGAGASTAGAEGAWEYEDGRWKYRLSDGNMASGWTLVNNIWYYLDPQTSILWQNAVTPDGYTVDADGAWVQ